MSHRRLMAKSSISADHFEFKALHPDDTTTWEREADL
ncbi:hypothetical protein CKAH01_08970 [Colletotrichum kahawae]|uniref:Uncharacterized protein n=1 Tax=Colletotrichum kahawae TaxID=34407 RepID=A0AAD9Y1D4_COLKA|nr:hypothetical protein CKAH01_08970 [Colletotrichum kahawae]